MNDDDDLRYPVGRFRHAGSATAADRGRWVAEVAELPARFGAAVAGLTPAQWATPYRPGGWTVRQVAHHLADSHVNAYTRFKLALTEDEPTIKPYDEARWAELADVELVDPAVSLALLGALHARWAALLERLTPDEWARGYRHPEHGRLFSLTEAVDMYAWHGRHHTAHVTGLRGRAGW